MLARQAAIVAPSIMAFHPAACPHMSAFTDRRRFPRSGARDQRATAPSLPPTWSQNGAHLFMDDSYRRDELRRIATPSTSTSHSEANRRARPRYPQAANLALRAERLSRCPQPVRLTLSTLPPRGMLIRCASESRRSCKPLMRLGLLPDQHSLSLHLNRPWNRRNTRNPLTPTRFKSEGRFEPAITGRLHLVLATQSVA